MKYRWWILGMFAAAAGGVIVLKHITDSKEKLLPAVKNNSEERYGEDPTLIHETEFDGTDFLA